MKILLPLLLLAVFALSACSRNQRKVNRIDGKWNIVNADIKGYGNADPDVIYEFEFCKLRQEDWCDFSIHNFDTDDLRTGLYTIDNRGTTLSMTTSNGFGFDYREYQIIKMSPWRMVLKTEDANVGELSRIVLRKVK